MSRTSWVAPAWLAALVAASAPGSAVAETSGPGLPAVQRWFATDRSLGCMDRQGTAAACGQANGPAISVFYGNADGGPGTSDAVAVVVYLPDPTGNAQVAAAAAFRQAGGGRYRLGRNLGSLPGGGVAPGSGVVFGGGKAVLEIEAMRPGDSRCCPTGRRRLAFDLR